MTITNRIPRPLALFLASTIMAFALLAPALIQPQTALAGYSVSCSSSPRRMTLNPGTGYDFWMAPQCSLSSLGIPLNAKSVTVTGSVSGIGWGDMWKIRTWENDWPNYYNSPTVGYGYTGSWPINSVVLDLTDSTTDDEHISLWHGWVPFSYNQVGPGHSGTLNVYFTPNF